MALRVGLAPIHKASVVMYSDQDKIALPVQISTAVQSLPLDEQGASRAFSIVQQVLKHPIAKQYGDITIDTLDQRGFEPVFDADKLIAFRVVQEPYWKRKVNAFLAQGDTAGAVAFARKQNGKTKEIMTYILAQAKSQSSDEKPPAALDALNRRRPQPAAPARFIPALPGARSPHTTDLQGKLNGWMTEELNKASLHDFIGFVSKSIADLKKAQMQVNKEDAINALRELEMAFIHDIKHSLANPPKNLQIPLIVREYLDAYLANSSTVGGMTILQPADALRKLYASQDTANLAKEFAMKEFLAVDLESAVVFVAPPVSPKEDRFAPHRILDPENVIVVNKGRALMTLENLTTQVQRRLTVQTVQTTPAVSIFLTRMKQNSEKLIGTLFNPQVSTGTGKKDISAILGDDFKAASKGIHGRIQNLAGEIEHSLLSTIGDLNNSSLNTAQKEQVVQALTEHLDVLMGRLAVYSKEFTGSFPADNMTTIHNSAIKLRARLFAAKQLILKQKEAIIEGREVKHDAFSAVVALVNAATPKLEIAPSGELTFVDRLRKITAEQKQLQFQLKQSSDLRDLFSSIRRLAGNGQGVFTGLLMEHEDGAAQDPQGRQTPQTALLHFMAGGLDILPKEVSLPVLSSNHEPTYVLFNRFAKSIGAKQ